MRHIASSFLLSLFCVQPLVANDQDIAAIPVDFFRDIELASPIPVEFTTGQAIRVSGTVFDSSLTMVGFAFFDKSGIDPLVLQAPVINGQFNRTLFFSHKTAGVYELDLYRYRGSSQSASQQDVFRPIYIKKGAGTAFFPFDYFEEITLTSPMPVVFAPGEKLRVNGTVSDPSVSYIDFYFWWLSTGYRTQLSGPTDAYFEAAVDSGRFNIKMDISTEQRPGNYWLDVSLHRRGSRSLGPRRFRPMTILPSPDFDGDGAINLADFLAFARVFGSSSVGARFRFDLDGDGEVGFSDFLIFARAFGTDGL